ncbi:MAG: recombinase family protein [Minisyncoccia bacterium]
MNKALIYCRVSTEEQAQSDRQSLKTQLRLCEKAIDDSSSYKLAENGVYEDPGKSATNMNRPGLQDMILRVQEDKSIGAVFVQDTDRVARNVSDHLTIKAILKKHNVELISVSQPSIEDSPEGNFMDLVIAGVNQFQSQITARKTIKSMEQKFNDGGWPTHAPIGYLNVGEKDNEEKRTVIVDPINGPLMVEAFKMYATGDYSVTAIVDCIHEKGFRSRTGKRIFANRMAEAFKNHFYYGEMRWRGLVNSKGKHQPIIDKELYDRCQRVARERDRYKLRRHTFNFILRSFVFCAVCKSKYVGDNNKVKKKSYYHCNRYRAKRYGEKITCTGRYVETYILENMIQEEFNKLQFTDKFITDIETKLKIAYETKKESVGTEKSRLLQAKIAVEKKLEVAEEKLIDGVLDNTSFERLKHKYRELIEDFENQLAKTERSKNMKMDTIQQVLALIRNIGQAYKEAKPTLKEMYIGLFWHHFEVEDRKIIQAVKSPIVLALEMAGSMAMSDLKKPIPNEYSDTGEPVRLSNVGGAYRDSNPD